MALTEREELAEVSISGKFKLINVKKVLIIERDGEEISSTNVRHSLTPVDDVSNEHDDVIAIANLFWTDELKAEYQAHMDSQRQ